MRPWIPAAVLLLASSAPGLAGEGEPEVPVRLLREAVAGGLVEARGEEPGAYTSVTLRLRSRAEVPLRLDLAGSHLRHRGSKPCQRLGLGPSADRSVATPDGSGRLLVELSPGAEVVLRLRTVCLDAGVATPTDQSFDVAPAALPPVREKVLRWWADHPDAPQSSVNTAIWQNRDRVTVAAGVVEDYRKARGLFGALHGGTAYRLLDGELTALDPDGIVRLLGTEIFQALPTAGGLYAVALGADGKPELWRHVLTGEQPWFRVMALPDAQRLKQLIPCGEDRLALVTDQGVSLLNPRTGATVAAVGGHTLLDASARRRGENVLSVILRVPGGEGVARQGDVEGKEQDIYELWEADVRKGEPRRIKRYWNVESVVAGPGGVFGLTHAGRLRVLEGDDFRNLPETEAWSRLLAVGPEILWVVGRDGRIAAAHARTGQRLHGSAIPGFDGTALSLDAVTGDLGVVRGSEFLRLPAAGGAPVTLARVPPPPAAAPAPADPAPR